MVPTAETYLRALGLDESAAKSLTRTQFNSIKYIVTEQECVDCKGKAKCSRFVAHIVNGEVTIEKTACKKSMEFETSEQARRIIKAAKVPQIFAHVRAKDFQDAIGRERCKANFNALTAAEDAIFNKQSLYIYGNAGTGKTFLSAVIANERAYVNKRSLFINVPDILDDLRDFNQNSIFTDHLTPQERLERIYKPSCLIVDDLGAEKPSDWTCETLFKIINRRYNDGKQMIITSNFDIDQLQARMNYTAGDRIIRRICDMCKPVHIV